MNNFRVEEIIRKIEEALALSKDGFAVAILCDRDHHLGEKLYTSLSEKTKAKLVLLDPNAEKHTLKRELNKHGCELIMYTGTLEPVIYELFNDGSTLLHESLLLDDFIIS